MDGISEKEYWSQKFRQRSGELMEAELFIKENIHYINKGSILDLACGDGRNAVYLAKCGFQITGVDFSDEAIKRLTNFSEINKVSISTKILDLNDTKELARLGKFNNIIINHYKPTIEIFKNLPQLLERDGVIIVCAFNYKQSEERGFPREHCLEKDELINVSNDLLLVKHEIMLDQRGHLDGYIFRLK